MPKSLIFLYFCLFFTGGVFLNSFLQISQLIMLGFLISGLILISVFWKYEKSRVLGFCLFFLVLGIYRYETADFKIKNNDFLEFNDKKENVVLIGEIIAEPDVRKSNVKLTISPQELEGKILVTANRYPEYQYGDRLKISGELLNPQEIEDFSYKDYLAKDGIFSVMYYPKTELLEKNQGNFIFAGILNFKNKLRESIYRNLSPPHSSILAAIILGDKRQISDEWKEKLNFAGVRHLTAVSGMHVAVLSAILMSFFLALGFWRKQAFYFTVFLIAFFIILTGLQTSAIRAGIMAGLFLLARHLGRENSSTRAIVLAASFMLLQNPLLLRFDVGFQLSFLAVMGIIYAGPIFQNWLRRIPDKFQLRSILAMTLSAQIFTLPILIYNFGYISQVAPLTNLLILPFLPYIMILGFICGFLGMLWTPLGWVFSLPVWLLLAYLTKIVEWFSALPFSVYFLEISWIWLLLSYLVLAFIVRGINDKIKE